MNNKRKIAFLALGLLLPCLLFAQSLSLKLDQVTVKQAINELKEKSGYAFLYVASDLDTGKIVSVDAQDLTTAINQILAGQNLSYEIQDKSIVISKKQPTSQKQSAPKTVKGYVLDANGDPLPGATVQVAGTDKGVLTNVDGSYEIKVAPTENLVYSFVGMQPQTLRVGERAILNVELSDDKDRLEDAVVVAFGTQKKESVVSSVATVDSKELVVVSSNLTTALAGKLPGIISYQTTGEPGADNAQFFVRGVTTFGYKSDPLILIDGFEASSTDLARLQPDDIESFSVLKDASASALYGSRGANGIILVNTKIGREGRAKVSVRIDQNISMPTQENELVDGITYMNMYNEAIYTRRDHTGVATDFYSSQKILGTQEGKYPLLYPNINWYDQLFKRHTFNTKANVNVSGGGNVATYYVAGGYDHETGLLKVDHRNNFNNNIDINRFNIRSNVQFKLTRTTKLDTRISGRFERYNGPYTSASSLFGMVMDANPVDYPAVWEPDAATKYMNRTLFGTATDAPGNPYATMVQGYESRDVTTINAQATLMQDLNMITKGLSAQLKASANVYSYYSQKRKYSPYYYALLTSNPDTGDYTLYCINPTNTSSKLGNVEPSRNGSGHYYFEGRINWNREFGKHDLSAMLVGTAEESVLTSGSSTSVFETLPERNLGLAGRFAYDYDSRYFLELNFGYNGSEKFAKKYRFGFFPSAGVGWIISNEKFFAPLKEAMPLLKLKFTYGKVGNDAIAGRADRFFFLSDISYSGGSEYWGMDWTKNSHRYYSVNRYANPDIQWEVSTKMNLGIEANFFKDEALKVQFDYFNDFRDKIYMTYVTYPKSAGFSATIAGNIGQVKSHGFEGSIDLKHFFTNNFWVTGRANFTYTDNVYVALSEVDYPEEYRSKVGHNINQHWGYIAERLFVDQEEIDNSPKQTFGYYMAGDIKYKDVNEDGVIDSSDQVPIGHPTVPRIQYGFGLSLGLYRWDLSFFFQGNAMVSFFINPKGIAPFENRRNALKVVANDYWTETDPDINAFWPRLSQTPLANNIQASTWWLRDGSFCRLKSAELGYTFLKWDKVGMENCRIYLSGENLFLFSPFKMWDPEMGGNGLGYPINRRFNVGVQLNF